MQPIEIVCHKGANEYAPENTYAAAQLCVEWGVAYVEIDVRTSKDGLFYLLHDETVDRTTNGQGPLVELTGAEIDQLDAGSWFHPRFADQRVPRLDLFLRWIKGKAKVFLDVKAADPQCLIDLIDAVGMTQEVFFWSGNNLWAEELHALAPHLALKINVKSVADVIHAHEHFGAAIVEVALADMSQPLQEACRARGIKVMIYHQQKDPAAFRSVLAWQADMINLNHADTFLSVLRNDHPA
ncbi:MAG: glycerophosphodiester phosphodiesterase family protein [Caldilineaceae bacterium]|nr:glycerophosphodiester phosphodiesterase family protein [Caldilineaceae bacterium]